MNYLLNIFEGETIFGIEWVFIISLIAAYFFLYKKVYIPWKESEIEKYKKQEEKDKMIQIAFDKVNSFQTLRENDRAQSFNIQEQLLNRLDVLSDKIDAMQKSTDERFLSSEKKQNERVQAELKDKIGESYRHYHERNKINSMELEALEGLIETYENFGGKNSFVHSVVQKEMYTWEQI